MAQRRPQIVGDGVTECAKFLVGGLQLRRAVGHALLQFRIEPAYFIFRVFALGDVVDVALDHPVGARLINVADELNVDKAAVARFHRQVVIVGKPILLQSFQHDRIRIDILE